MPTEYRQPGPTDRTGLTSRDRAAALLRELKALGSLDEGPAIGLLAATLEAAEEVAATNQRMWQRRADVAEVLAYAEEWERIAEKQALRADYRPALAEGLTNNARAVRMVHFAMKEKDAAQQPAPDASAYEGLGPQEAEAFFEQRSRTFLHWLRGATREYGFDCWVTALVDGRFIRVASGGTSDTGRAVARVIGLDLKDKMMLAGQMAGKA